MKFLGCKIIKCKADRFNVKSVEYIKICTYYKIIKLLVSIRNYRAKNDCTAILIKRATLFIPAPVSAHQLKVISLHAVTAEL